MLPFWTTPSSLHVLIPLPHLSFPTTSMSGEQPQGNVAQPVYASVSQPSDGAYVGQQYPQYGALQPGQYVVGVSTPNDPPAYAAPPAEFHNQRANAICKKCGHIYDLPLSADSWRCKNWCV